MSRTKTILLAASAAAATAFISPAVAAASVKPQALDGGAITIQSWLYAVPSENLLSATVWDCFKITGAINDQGGGPTWTDDASYAAPNTMTSGGVTAASRECADKVPTGGFILVPPPEPGQYQYATYTTGAGSPGGLSTLYAVHTITGQRGDIYITFAATYNMTNSPVPVKLPNGSTVEVQPLTTGPECTWLITGGTGAYTGLQGDGTCFGNGENTFPWINHTEQGQVWWPTGANQDRLHAK